MWPLESLWDAVSLPLWKGKGVRRDRELLKVTYVPSSHFLSCTSDMPSARWGWAHTVPPNLLPEGRVVPRPSLRPMGREIARPQGRKRNILNDKFYPKEGGLSLLTSRTQPCLFPVIAELQTVGTRTQLQNPLEHRNTRIGAETQSRCSHQGADWRERRVTHSIGTLPLWQLSRGSQLFRLAPVGQSSTPALSGPCNAGMKNSEHRCQSIKRRKVYQELEQRCSLCVRPSPP